MLSVVTSCEFKAEKIIHSWSHAFVANNKVVLTRTCIDAVNIHKIWICAMWKIQIKRAHLSPVNINLITLLKHISETCYKNRVCRVLSSCGARGPGFDSRTRHLNFQRLVISCFQVAIWLKYQWSDVNPQYNQITNQVVLRQIRLILWFFCIENM